MLIAVVIVLGLVFYIQTSAWKSRMESDMQKMHAYIQQLNTKIESLKNPGISPGSTEVADADQVGNHIETDEVYDEKEQLLDQSYIQPVSQQTQSGPADWSWLTKDRPMKLGGLIFLLGLIWGVSYAFANNRVPARARIALGLGAGVFSMVAGYLRQRTHQSQGSLLLGLGSAIILIVMYLGRLYYGYFSPVMILGVSTIVVAVQAYIAITKDLPAYATYALLLGLVAPLLTYSQDPSFALLFIYLAVLYVGSMVVMRQTGRSRLPLIGLISYILYSGPYIRSASVVTGDQIALLLTTAIFLIFGISNILDRLYHQDKTPDYSLITAFLNAMFHLVWIHVLIPDEYKSVVILIFAILFGCAVWMLYSSRKAPQAIYTYGAIGVIYLLVATTYEFDGPTLILAYIAEVLAISMTILFALKHPKNSMLALLGLMGPFALATSQGMLDLTNRLGGVSHKYALILGIFVVSLFGLSAVYAWYQARYLSSDHDDHQALNQSILILNVLGIICGVGWIYLAFAGVELDHIWIYRGGASLTFGVLVYLASRRLFTQSSYVYVSSLICCLPILFGYIPAILTGLSDTNAMLSLAVIFVSIVLLVVLARQIGASDDLDDADQQRSIMYFTAAVLVLLGAIWFFADYFFADSNTSSMVSLITYTVLGLIGYVIGSNRGHKRVIYLASIVLGGVILRLLIVDVRAMNILWRIVTFIVIGLLLLGSTYFVKGSEDANQ